AALRESIGRNERFGGHVLMDFGFRISDFGWVAGLLLAAAPVLGAEESKLARDGSFWVQTITGSEAAVPGGRLRISTRGAATVRGGAEDQVRYTVTKRVKANSQAEARRLRSEEHTSELQSPDHLVCRLLLEKK